MAGFFDIDVLKQEKRKLEAEMAQKDFWAQADQAKKIGERHSFLAKEIEQWEKIAQEAKDLLIFVSELDDSDRSRTPRGESDSSGNDNDELWQEAEKQYAILKKEFDALEFLKLFSGKYDRNDALMAIHAGTGGTEAQDWAEMLLRMYLRFCERKGFISRVVDKSEGGEAGIKSATLEISGLFAYGWLRSEAGVHRLVRISPFDAEKMRHTSFALVEVLPILGDLEITIDPKDLKMETFLSSGHGGQSVQTTYSAVRLTHLPTGIVVSCQNERSQQQNKETAMKILRGKLHVLVEAERRKEKEKIRGEYKEGSWGNQIRSYVLHPYHMVKDLRTKYETSDTQAVLDGELEPFVEAYLRKN